MGNVNKVKSLKVRLFSLSLFPCIFVYQYFHICFALLLYCCNLTGSFSMQRNP